MMFPISRQIRSAEDRVHWRPDGGFATGFVDAVAALIEPALRCVRQLLS
jgi:hypothetical protein